MSVAVEPVHYPESDGKPMAETDVHRDEMVYFIEALREHFRDREAYVSGNLLLYYVEGDPKKCVSPDCLVAFDRPAGRRRIYKTWEEGKVPDVVIEVTSSSTRREDQVTKRSLYARLGVRELWLVDPLGDYLRAPFRGYRLEGGDWQEIPVERGQARSPLLGLDFRVTEDGVRLYDPARDRFLPSPADLANQLRYASAELQQTSAELQQTSEHLRETEAALRAREEENARLRALLARLQQQGSAQEDR